jgi:hypothetical protein
MSVGGVAGDTDPYLVFLAGARISATEVADIVGRTLKHVQEAQQVADSTSFEKNIHLVNILI